MITISITSLIITIYTIIAIITGIALIPMSILGGKMDDFIGAILSSIFWPIKLISLLF